MGESLPKAVRGNGAAQVASEVGSAFVEGVSPSMSAVEAIIRELAQSDVPVVVLAERGAGKLATAQRIHAMSRRSGHAFRVAVCATLQPEELTGEPAQDVLRGQGTIFLQELACLSAACQERLLEALTTGENHGVAPGDHARLICGSSRDLEAEVKAGRLREDLYYRLSGVCLRVPPLRQRKEDIPALMEHFLQRYARDFNRPVPSLSAETQHLFQDYAWPGNVRELEDAAKALVALGDENVAMGGLRVLLRKADGGHGTSISLKQAARAASREAEKELILKVLTRTRWNRRRAAQELQISYKALLYKLKQIGFEGVEAR